MSFSFKNPYATHPRKVVNTENLPSKYSEFHRGNVPQIRATLSCGHKVEFGTTGVLFDELDCKECAALDDKTQS